MKAFRSRATTLLAAGLALAIAGAASAAEEVALRAARVCDPTGCYYTWFIVDSDGDGVADADEIVARSDPHDPFDTPPLDLLVELMGIRALPSFEVGLGKAVINPVEMMALIGDRGPGDELSAAFPIGERKDVLARLGISIDVAAEYGIDIERDGGTIEAMFESDDKPPIGKRVGGVEMSWISNDGGVDDVAPNDTIVDQRSFPDGSMEYKTKGGDIIFEGADGHGWRRDKDDNLIAKWYVNPDAESNDGPPTEEQIKAWKRIRGAAVRTVAGWRAPEFDEDDIVDPKDAIILLNPDYVEFSATVTDPVDYNRAQPRTVPGHMPDPQLPGGGCWPRCH